LETLKTVASITGPIVGIVSLLAAYIYYTRSRKYKALTYEVSPVLSLVQVGGAIKDKVTVEYDGELIENLSGVTIVIRSSGTEPVQFKLDADAHDTETPVTIDFGSGTRILGEPAVDPEPKNLKVSAIKDPENPTTVVVDKFLLNPGQSVTVSTFADNLRNSPRVYGNIAGVQLHQERTRERRPWTSDPAISDIGSWILDPVIGTIIGTVIVIVGALILFVYIWPILR
jgi:hypothetical protein